MINRLIVNGCSYMAYYDKGGGTKELADKLSMTSYDSLAKNSVCNSRILRTTLRDMYSACEPTLYVVGTTFVHRFELTTLDHAEEDGLWQSFNGHTINLTDNRRAEITDSDLESYNRAWNNIMYDNELFEDLVYRVCSLVGAAKNLGHRMLVFNTAEHLVDYIDSSKYKMLDNKSEIIGKLFWRSIPWQQAQGAQWPKEDAGYPKNCRHVQPGDHKWLNEFLINYINHHKLLE